MAVEKFKGKPDVRPKIQENPYKNIFQRILVLHVDHDSLSILRGSLQHVSIKPRNQLGSVPVLFLLNNQFA